MHKYRIELKEIEIYEIEVEAEDEDTAMEKAWSEIEDDKGRLNWHSDSDSDGCIIEGPDF